MAQCDPVFIVIQFSECLPFYVHTFEDLRRFYEKALQSRDPVLDRVVFY